MRVTVRKMGDRVRSASTWGRSTQLAILGIFFSLGTLGGFSFSGWSGDSPELLDHLLAYFQSAGQGSGIEPSLWSSIWDLARWPLAAFLLGSTALGVVGIPLLLGARGFFLAYSASAFSRMFGLPGMAASLAAFGITAVVAVPVLFVLSADAFRQSLSRSFGERPFALDQRAQALSPCAGLLVLAVALQQTLMPALFTAVCSRFFIS